MPDKSGLTVPFENRQQVKKAAKYLAENFDEAYALAFKLAANSGLRISDVLHLRYEQFDFEQLSVEVVESKGTKQNIANARHKVLKRVKDMLIVTTADAVQKGEIYLTPPKDILPMVPDRLRAKVDAMLVEAETKAKPKKRVVVFPLQLINQIKRRMRKFTGIDDGLIFSRKTLPSNRARSMDGVLSRQNVWAVFSTISAALKLSFNTSCHQLRKSFAVFLYHKTKKDSALVVHTVGWKDNALLQRYLSIEDKQSKTAMSLFQKGYT